MTCSTAAMNFLGTCTPVDKQNLKVFKNQKLSLHLFSANNEKLITVLENVPILVKHYLCHFEISWL